MTAIVTNEEHWPAPRSWDWAQGRTARDCWDDWAKAVSGWCGDNGLSPRDVVVLLPVGALLPVARQAWARAVEGWLPQIETVPTLAEALAWSRPMREAAPVDPAVGPPPTLDVVLDRLLVTQALNAQAWGRQWAQRDRRAFEHAVVQVVDAGHGWVRVAQSWPPERRADYWEACREAMAEAANAAGSGPGARERLLLAWALEWAASADDGRWNTDVLFSHRAAAWVGVTAGATVVPGSESSIMLAVLAQATQTGVPTLWMNAEAVPQAGSEAPALARCIDFEDEAQQATAHVLAAVNHARAVAGDPVALVALDRGLVRRVRALLEGAGATVSDETGWKLSTTRAGAAVTRLLAASRPDASTDDLLDWLKSGWASWPQSMEAEDLHAAVSALETWCRRHGFLSAWALGKEGADGGAAGQRQAMPEPARRLWQRARQTAELLSPLWASRRLPLSQLLACLANALKDCGAWQTLMNDPAGESVLQALRLSEGEGPSAWPLVANDVVMDGQGLSRWVDQVLEASSFKLASANAGEARADVVITPLTRAVLRPFSAVVMPGADERQLGAMEGVPGWVNGRLSEAMGLPSKTTSRDAQWASFALLMAQPEVACLCREANGREPLEPSPWFERWSVKSGQFVRELGDARQSLTVPVRPVSPPQPSLRASTAPGAAPGPLQLPLPAQITATSYEALRQCPYRFFAQHVLGLRALDELEEGVDRSDFGIWLHAVLQSFHASREAEPVQDDVALWVRCAEAVTRAQGLDRDQRRPFFLPFAATLERLAQNYVAWLHSHEAEGWRFAKAEEVVRWPIALQNDLGEDVTVTLHGQLDRLDRQGQGGDAAWCVIDYKTGSQEGLKQKVKQSLEDTQLAFYAALAQHAPATADPSDPHKVTQSVDGMYLHLDEKGVTAIKHPEVVASAQALVQGVRMDLTRLLAGAAMPALGEGVACEYCDVRGLCRRDHWTVPETKP